MYQVLARKYRPRNFNELVGQNHVSRALTSALDRGRLHHAYLFTGTRGVGKTTIARILAKCLNCETGVTSTPCEVCATCKAVNEGRFIDLIEIDAASRTKVEDTRELLDNVPYAPTQGRFKVYLIDEVHMLSTHSFNALLKTLEEPPAHVKFLFATTDPQKLPITVISRCLQFTLRPLAVDEITHHLTDILQKEQIQSEQDAIWQIAESAQGSLRDALSLTDQAIAYGQGAIHHQDVKEMLGLIDRTIIYDLILAIHQNQRERVSQLLLQFRQQALDVSLVLDQFISTLHELAMLQYLPDLSLKYSAEINQKIMQLSHMVSAPDLQLYYQIACKGRAELQLAVTQEQGFEMTILRLLAFRPIQANEIVVSATQINHVHSEPANSDHQSDQINIETQQVQAHLVDQSNHNQVNEQKAVVETYTVPSVEGSAVNLVHDKQSSKDIQSDSREQSAPFVDPAFEEIEDELSEHHVVDDEPNSDDYLQDESSVSNPAQQQNSQTEHSESVSQIKEIIQNDNESESSTQLVEQDVELELTSFGADFSQPQQAKSQVDSQQDVFFLAPETDVESVAQLENSSVIVDASTHDHQQIVQENLVPENLQKDSVNQQFGQTPQQILQLASQQLEGEWDVDKWEYWFRNSSLSPAVQELAQHGLMIGQINGHSNFQISKQYENLLNQAQHDLEASLKEQWANTVFNVQYGEVATITPYMMQNERKVRAFDRASEMLHQEPTVKSLLEAFDGQLENIQLK